MPAVSVIVTASLARWDNLCQTLRMLEAHEPGLDMEIVVVCQDAAGDLPATKGRCVVVELGSPDFRKGLMVNRGVGASSRDVVVLLDGDRVNRPRYLEEAAGRISSIGGVVAPIAIRNLPGPCGDDALSAALAGGASLPGADEFRHFPPGFFHKTHFSGNAIMRRRDFDAVGGMDASYSGYGFSDNDFAMACYRFGMRLHFSPAMDLHLWHPRECGEEAYMRQNCGNGVFFCKKWGVWPDPSSCPPGFQASMLH